MTRDTKVGLLAGLAFIICFAIILSNRGAQIPEKVDHPYLVDHGANTRPAVQPASSPLQANPTLSGRVRQAPPLQPQASVAHRPATPAAAGNVGDNQAGGGLATTGGAIVLPMQTVADPYAQPQNAVQTAAQRRPFADSIGQFASPMQPVSDGGHVSGVPGGLPPTHQAEQERIIRPDAVLTGPDDRPSEQIPSSSAVVADQSVPAGSTSAPVSGRRYTVVPGDTLYKIAQQHYGSRSASVVNAVFQANRSVLSSPDAMTAGMELTLPILSRGGAAAGGSPPAEEKRATGSPQKPAPKPEPMDHPLRWYQVKRNDRYVSIAREQLGDANRWPEIYQLNKDKFPDPGRIREGVRIKLPASVVATTAGARP